MVASRPGPPGQHSSTTPIWAAIARALPRDSYAMRLTSVTHGKIAIGRQGLTNITEFLAIGVLSQGSLREEFCRGDLANEQDDRCMSLLRSICCLFGGRCAGEEPKPTTETMRGEAPSDLGQ